MAGSLTLDLRIPSDLQQIEGVVEEVLRGCASKAVDVGALGNRFKVALCEALSNAIICGNGEDARKEVRVRVEVRDDVVIVEVEDEGQGFDLDACTEDCTAPENIEREDGRGLFLMRALVERVENFRVRGATQGNVVRLTVRHPGRAGHAA
jgi:serine/threonine-protein kinase RsbW